MLNRRSLPILIAFALLGALALVACSEQREPEQAATEAAAPATAAETRAEVVARAGAPLFDGMGDHHHPITTKDPSAQRYFDQGLVIDFAFNHAESVRSFRAAQALDPECAMCFWGEALALGPNINVTSNGKAVMSDEARLAAHAAIQKAVALKDQASEAERGYIDALATRYGGDFEAPREPQDLAYADAMRALYAKYPEDDDAASLFAEALMTTMPWDYWLDPEIPKPHTLEVIDALETVLARSPDHPMALHLYIHAMEASSAPNRAEAAADTLADLVPGAGHLVHMPAHIYWRVGRYHDAAEANVRAAAVDEDYIAQCKAQGFYPALYYPHNIHFLWAASSMEGRSEVAIQAARRVAANVRLEVIQEFPMVEFFHTIPLLALTQFGRWDALLQEPQPAAELEYSNAIWHYARATAYANLGDLDAARAEHAALVPLRESTKVHFLDKVDYPASQLLLIADQLIQGEIALASGDTAGAVVHYRAAVAAQDALPYTEPPFWYYPTRQSLGKALMAAEQPAEAEAVYREDLKIYPHNGWSMYGLLLSLEAQGKADEAAEVRTMFEHAWSLADVELTSSRF
jgi:tetratricopeptide (TPR) repeat protein